MSMSNEHAFSLATDLASLLGFTALGSLFVKLLRHRSVGHRMLLWVTIICCFIRAAASLFSAYNTLHHGQHLLSVIGYFFGALAICGIAITFWSQYHAILRAARTDRRDDLRQAEIQLQYLALQKKDAATLKRSEQLRRLQREGQLP